MSKRVFLLFGCLAGWVWADPLNQGLDLGTSTSQSYEARNVLIQPAALGFDTALNGFELSSSFAYATTASQTGDYALALALGYFGFGAEYLSDAGLSRYQFALGVPLGSRVFFGTRLGLYRYNSGDGMNSWDFGLQYRPVRSLSFGLLLDKINQPLLGGAPVPLLSVLSGTLRPWQNLELTVDASTPSNAFFKTAAFQGMVGWRILEGLRVRVGYHTDYRWLVGAQIHFGNASLFTSVQPSSANRQVMAGFQSAITPYKSRLAPSKSIKMRVGSELSNEKSPGNLFAAARPSLLDLLKGLDEIGQDRSVKSVLLQIESFPLGLASAQDVHAALQRLRQSGKTVHVYLGNAGIKEYLIASAANRIFLEPSGEIRWLGIRSERYFLRGTLDKIGVGGEFLAAGKYKSAPEMFLRKDSSEPARQATREELQSLEESLIQILKAARHIDSKRWEKLLELGLLSAEEAKEQGLVDGLESFTSGVKAEQQNHWVASAGRTRPDTLALPPRVAVIVASGNILPSRIRLLSLNGTAQLTPSSIHEKVEQAEQDSRTRAVVLRVASPGGEVLASQKIASEIEALGSQKPILVSMGDVAASGGYYISAPAQTIFASPLTVTGSIGVFLGKFQTKRLYEWLDLHKEIQTNGPYPGLYSEERPWTAAEKTVMQRRLDHYYANFVDYVATQRHLQKPKVLAAAQGRVWTGRQALEHGLVDKLAGYYESIQLAAEQAGLPPDGYSIWEVEAPTGLFGLFPQEPWGAAGAQTPWLDVPPFSELQNLSWFLSLRRTPFLYLDPYNPPDA